MPAVASTPARAQDNRRIALPLQLNGHNLTGVLPQARSGPTDPPTGSVVAVSTRLVFGTAVALASALAASAVSTVVNTCFVERHNGTDRNRCSRKVRKSYGFSKDGETHRAATVFSYFSYNFCWPVRTLRVRNGERWGQRTPAMAAGLTDHVWSLSEWLAYPAVQRK